MHGHMNVKDLILSYIRVFVLQGTTVTVMTAKEYKFFYQSLRRHYDVTPSYPETPNKCLKSVCHPTNAILYAPFMT